ncbi:MULTISPECIES: hypothetical protein [Photobacterium]|uniref:hypothetical protein n=1 Tax=Photobacterium TaxID=657 RepID=UPI001C2D4DFF|nr:MULTISPECIES: hypothetical protein [Photobacterium]MBV1840859.1 hypothetical protein [Photobacterium ganghwense]
MNTQHCPQCRHPISAPSLRQYDDYFICPHCHGALSHNETDIMLYALGFITLFTPVLMMAAGMNIFIAMVVVMLSYHLLRPMLIERFFRLRLLDLSPLSQPENQPTSD